MTDIDHLLAAAVVAGRTSASSAATDRARWLHAVADAVDAAAVELIELADRETHLGEVRLRGELARTTAQLRKLGDAAVEGGYLEATIDHPDSTATPPVPDLRRMLIPFTVVAVYAASNFPFAFSVLGGDTAAALAVGSAVVVKAHPGHEALSARITEIANDALDRSGAPRALLQTESGYDFGLALVRHPDVDAVAFTGSVKGGRALFDAAAARPRPVPFFGELGSVNPVVITDTALSRRGEELASGLAASFTLGLGQFCTKPGIVFVPRASSFADLVVSRLRDGGRGVMLTESIREGFGDSVGRLSAVDGVELKTELPEGSGPVRPVVLTTTAEAYLAEPDATTEECFGPAALIVEYENAEQVREMLRAVGGSLTATLHSETGDAVGGIIDVMKSIAGRVLFSGWPTGVAVSWAQTHGGPYPSSTSQFTSVGQSSMRRFLRPISFQDAPAEHLPVELLDHNPLGIPRRVDGLLMTA